MSAGGNSRRIDLQAERKREKEREFESMDEA
jgi:hypothetical protein